MGGRGGRGDEGVDGWEGSSGESDRGGGGGGFLAGEFVLQICVVENKLPIQLTIGSCACVNMYDCDFSVKGVIMCADQSGNKHVHHQNDTSHMTQVIQHMLISMHLKQLIA